MEEEDIIQLFESNYNAYMSVTHGGSKEKKTEIVPAMTKERFIEVITGLELNNSINDKE